MKENSKYHPEPYWSEVAKRIKKREDGSLIAGDDEPFYRYKRFKFLNLLRQLKVTNKSVLEVGSGPGGNLMSLKSQKPSRLVGVDISQEMVDLAKKNLTNNIEIIKIDGSTLPFSDGEFDIVFTATVLQHNTDEKMLQQIAKEICRVSKKQVIIFERTNKTITGDALCIGRPVTYYEDLMHQNGFKLEQTKYLNIYVSYLVSGAIRKLLNPKSRREGEPLNMLSNFLQRISLSVTRRLDNVFTKKSDLTKMTFSKT